jgi:type II secretory ATPase GspE/PulE/Tfp pilus assembly ATPase PilB-like protein
MGIEPYLLSAALNGAVAQRLARTICPSCATKYYPTEQVLRDAGLTHESGRPFLKGAGCQRCHDSGYQGRVGVYEVFEVTPEIRRMVHHGRPTHEIRGRMKHDGLLTLREEGVQIALAGRTNLEEILRVTQEDDEIAAAPAAPASPVGAPQRKEAA